MLTTLYNQLAIDPCIHLSDIAAFLQKEFDVNWCLLKLNLCIAVVSARAPQLCHLSSLELNFKVSI